MFNSKKKINCPFCVDKQSKTIIISPDKDNYYLPSFKPELEALFNPKKSKNGIQLHYKYQDFRIYHCTTCNSKFNKKGSYYAKKNPSQIDLVKQWALSKKATPDILKTINSIGLTELWTPMLPCKITTTNNQIFDFALLIVSSEIPFGEWYDKYEYIFLIDDIKSIEKSPFALSKTIRKEYTKTGAKNDTPILLQTKTNEEIIVSNVQFFFNNGTIKGEDLALSNQKIEADKDYIKDYTTRSQVLVIVKS